MFFVKIILNTIINKKSVVDEDHLVIDSSSS